MGLLEAGTIPSLGSYVAIFHSYWLVLQSFDGQLTLHIQSTISTASIYRSSFNRFLYIDFTLKYTHRPLRTKKYKCQLRYLHGRSLANLTAEHPLTIDIMAEKVDIFICGSGERRISLLYLSLSFTTPLC